LRVRALVVGLAVGATLGCSTGPTYTVVGGWQLGSSLLWLAQSGTSFAGYEFGAPAVANAPTLRDSLVCGTVIGAQVRLTLPVVTGGGEFVGTFRDAATIVGTLTASPLPPQAATMTKALAPTSIMGSGGIGPQVFPPSHC
jgi:hypothetical protein